jgi:hypothetical protein
MLTEVAFVVVQFKTVDAPGAMLAGCALNEIVGFWPLVTLTVSEACAFPRDPVAVAVYVVVVVGVTFSEPLTGKLPKPLMVTELALLASQLSIVEAPLATELGSAFRVIAGALSVGLFCVAIEPPPHPRVGIKIAINKIADMRRKYRISTPSFMECVQTKRLEFSWVRLILCSGVSSTQAKMPE